MGTVELIITAIALSMDAFAVALCKGLATQNVKYKHAIITGVWFGGFQALMPLIGFFLASLFASFIEPVSSYVAFILLTLIGINMIKESFEKEEDECECGSFAPLTMLPLALATSIDALTVGVGFAMIKDLDIYLAVASIGIITFVLSALGVKLGSVFGTRVGKVAERTGGGILIFMGLNILLEYFGVSILPFL